MGDRGSPFDRIRGVLPAVFGWAFGWVFGLLNVFIFGLTFIPVVAWCTLVEFFRGATSTRTSPAKAAFHPAKRNM